MRCEWRFTSDLHIAKVFPSLGVRLMDAAFAQWPIAMEDAPVPREEPVAVSFVIGHRGLDRLPLLRATLRSIAGQREVGIECIVVESPAKSWAPVSSRSRAMPKSSTLRVPSSVTKRLPGFRSR